MLLAYIDESRNADTYFVNTLLVRDVDVIPLGNALNLLRKNIAEEYRLNANIEFHGYDILNGKNEWILLGSDYDAQINIFNKIIDCVLQFNVGIYIKGIGIANFISRYGTDESLLHNAALIWNLEKVQNKAMQNSDIVLVIADEVGAQSSFYRANLRFHQANATFGWDPEILDRIADTIHFAPSRESSLIQAVDMIAHANVRAHRLDQRPELVTFQKGLHDKLRASGRLCYFGIW
ncbi:MAG: DUF3800 domain-containing protein [Candidatus Planktophila sp.]|nr:DUF3800 domain-containing protein [Candidatus Planktophila sp.]